MAFWRYYRCHCVDWSKDPIKVLETDAHSKYEGKQHFQLHEGHGMNPKCNKYLKLLKEEAAPTGAKQENTLVPEKPSTAGYNEDVSGVTLAAELIEHVFHGQLNAGTATGFHSLALVPQNPAGTPTLPWEKIRDFEVRSRPDGCGVYFARFKMLISTVNHVESLTAFKPSAMFPVSWNRTRVEEEIKLAHANPLTMRHNSIDWSGKCRNGMIIGGRSAGNGAVKSAFPAFRDSFDIPL